MSQQSKQNTNEDLLHFILGLFLVGIFLYKFNIPDKVEALKNKITSNISLIFNSLISWKYLIVFIITLLIIGYSIYKITKIIPIRISDKKERRNRLKAREELIINLIEEDIDSLNYEEINEVIVKLKDNISFCSNYPKFKHYFDDLNIKIKEAKLKLIELRDKERLHKKREEKYQLKNDIEELENKKFRLKRSMEENEIEILRNLKIDENYVFNKDNLTKKEFSVLLKKNYRQTNQYCVKEKRLITALVKPILNHGLSHTFLVWSVIRLLKTLKGIKEIKVHQTVDADITFKYNNKIFALEIETGTLLSKKKQTEEKVNYLNNKYPNKWMFIVSNKDLIWRYRKLGFSTQRNEVEKNLQILLRNSWTTTPSFSGWSSAFIDEDF